MIIGVVKECIADECRVAITPTATARLRKLGYQVYVESGAGSRASFLDPQFRDAGAEVLDRREQVLAVADIVLLVSPPTLAVVDELRPGCHLIGFVWPAMNPEVVERLRERKITTMAMDCVPRISRAQKMDALSSMANIAGYRAVIEAANEFGSFFTGQITAAGKVPPAKVMVIGAGVAGLAAIGTAKSLGAIVRAFDTRLAVKDQVKSMGADFLELEFEESGEGEGGYAKTMSDEFIAAEMALFAQQAKEVDIIVTTALVPGKPAPKLITREMVMSMRPGSVIVDLASQQGGNCELTVPGEKALTHDVTIIGYTDFPSRLPTQASNLYANNIVNLIAEMTPSSDGELVVNLDDVVVRGSLVTHDGAITWPPPAIVNPTPPAKPEAPTLVASHGPSSAAVHWLWTLLLGVIAIALVGLMSWYAPPEFVSHFTVFILACFVGWQLVWNVTPALHTPLMSVTNAISGIIVIGGLLQMSSPWYSLSSLLAVLAVLIATINVAGGFLVTQRMLSMFRKQD